MTLNAVMLSLGPSLNIPGGILTELLEKRSTLFASPPPLSTIPLIDFGDTSITPPQLPGSFQPAQAMKISPSPLDSPRKILGSPTWLPSKPSLPRLTNNGSTPLAQKASDEAMRPWKIDESPPRLGLPTFITPKQLDFAADLKPVEHDVDQLNEPIFSTNTNKDDVVKRYSTGDSPFRPASTPIADLYRASESPLPPLRAQKSDVGLSGSSDFVPRKLNDTQIPRLGEVHLINGASFINPSSVLQRGSPVFFHQPTGMPERHGRPPSGTPIGVKRKDDSPTLPTVSLGTEGDESGRVKRMSAGPGAVSVREAVRTMEMTA